MWDPDDALLALYEQYAARLYTYCVRVTGSPDDAADALQETFTSVYRRLSATASRSSTRAPTSSRPPRNACLRRVDDRRRVAVVDELPERARRRRAARGGARRPDPRPPGRGPAANARLPDRQREVLVLREVEEHVLRGHRRAHGPARPTRSRSSRGARALNLRTALRRGALSSIAPVSEACERALTLLALSEDGDLTDRRQRPARRPPRRLRRAAAPTARAMLEAGTTYRSWTPVAAAPIAAELMLENAQAEQRRVVMINCIILFLLAFGCSPAGD